jgi:hypothetical protein
LAAPVAVSNRPAYRRTNEDLRRVLTDEHLQGSMRIAKTKIEPHNEKPFKVKQKQPIKQPSID